MKGYDFAPILEDGSPVGYVGIDILAEADDDKPLQRVLNNIQLQHIISSDAEFYDILTGLEEQFFYFLGGKNRVTGILPRADMNTSPARIHLLDLTFRTRDCRHRIRMSPPCYNDWDCS